MSSDFMALYQANFPKFASSLLSLKLTLSRTDIIYTIVFEKFGSPLAQFLSIMNTLMSLGIIGMLISEARVFESLL
jgi:hypothetical protein